MNYLQFTKKALTLVLVATISSSYSCDELLKEYSFECALQDDYQETINTLKNDFDIDAEYTASYRSLRLIEQVDYYAKRRSVDYLPWKIYEPAPMTWILWEKGADLIEKMAQDKSLEELTIDDIEKINSALISKEMMTTLSRIKGNRPGRIRSALNLLPPGFEFKCDSNPISHSNYQLILNYDLKDYENRPLLRPIFFRQCNNRPGYSGQVWYLASDRVKTEMNRWLENFNLYLNKYLTGEKADISPIEFIAKSQRWFIAIHPFGDGNGRTSRFIQDLFLKKLGLPYIPTGKLSLLSTQDEYIQDSMKETKISVEHLKKCLSNYQGRKVNANIIISGHCLPLYQDADTGESKRRKSERLKFAQELKNSLKDQ